MLSSILYFSVFISFINIFAEVAAQASGSALMLMVATLSITRNRHHWYFAYGALSNKCYLNLNINCVIESESSMYATSCRCFSWLEGSISYDDDFPKA